MGLRRVLPVLAVCAAAAAALSGCGAKEHEIDPALKAGTFQMGVDAQDREWILAAIDKVRPEARQLIDDVDGMVTIGTVNEPGASSEVMMIGSHWLPTAHSWPPRSTTMVPSVANSSKITTPGATVSEPCDFTRSWPRTR